jgi:hypothetical protein
MGRHIPGSMSIGEGTFAVIDWDLRSECGIKRDICHSESSAAHPRKSFIQSKMANVTPEPSRPTCNGRLVGSDPRIFKASHPNLSS